MAVAIGPIVVEELFGLSNIGIYERSGYYKVTMSDKYICAIETESTNTNIRKNKQTKPRKFAVIADVNMPTSQPLRLPVTKHAGWALVNPDYRFLAVIVEDTSDSYDMVHLVIFSIETGAEMKNHQMYDQRFAFWRWINPKTLGIVTQKSVYHWSIEADSVPVKMFEASHELWEYYIVNYICDPSEKWLVLIGYDRYQKEKSTPTYTQIFSVDDQCNYVIEAHTAAFAQFMVPGNENPSILFSYAIKRLSTGKIELGFAEIDPQSGKLSFTEKKASFCSPEASEAYKDDIPIAMQISHNYGLIHVITKFGLFFVYDLKTDNVIYKIISPWPIICTSESSSIKGFYFINENGRVLLASVNEAEIVPFASVQPENIIPSFEEKSTLDVSESLQVEKNTIAEDVGESSDQDKISVDFLKEVSSIKNQLSSIFDALVVIGKHLGVEQQFKFNNVLDDNDDEKDDDDDEEVEHDDESDENDDLRDRR